MGEHGGKLRHAKDSWCLNKLWTCWICHSCGSKLAQSRIYWELKLHLYNRVHTSGNSTILHS